MARTSTFTLLPTQIKFIEIPHNNPKDVSLYQGGYGSGKTWIGAFRGIMLCLKYPGIFGLVGAMTTGMVENTTLRMYFQHLEDMGINYTFNKAKRILKFDNGSEIMFSHLANPDRLKSLNLGFAELEEMSDVPQGTFDMLLGRLRQKKREEWGDNFQYCLFGHTNPEGQRGWIYRYFVEDKDRNGFRRVIAPTIENIFLPDGYAEDLKKTYSDEYYRVNVLGEDINYTKGLCTRGFNKNEQVKDSITLNSINPKYPIHLTCDFNRDPMCWYICQIIDDNIYVIYELVEEKTTTEYCIEFISKHVLTNYKECDIIINGDSTGNSQTTKGADYTIMMNILSRDGFKNVSLSILPKNPSIVWRIDCWNSMILDMEKKHRIFISSQCKYLIYNIENLETETGGSKPKIPTSGKLRSDPYAKYLVHPIDSVSYLCCMYFPVVDVNIEDYKGGSMYNLYRDNDYNSGVS